MNPYAVTATASGRRSLGLLERSDVSKTETTPSASSTRRKPSRPPGARAACRLPGRYAQYVFVERYGISPKSVQRFYRAAWAQAVSAIDHWFHEELYRRVAELAGKDSPGMPYQLTSFELHRGRGPDGLESGDCWASA